MTSLRNFVVVATLAFAVLAISFGISDNDVGGSLMVITFVVASLAVYFLPTVIAMARQHPAQVSILLVNLFLGWTLIGWVAALAWSAMPITERRLTPMERELIERRIADQLH
jgi:hypothetical protein